VAQALSMSWIELRRGGRGDVLSGQRTAESPMGEAGATDTSTRGMMDKVFRDFGTLLAQRFADNVQTTEDSVRYTFFAAMLKNGIRPGQVVLEYPHPAIPGAEVDTWFEAENGEAVALEFKYHRDPPSGKNQPKTMKAGDVFKDLDRLRRLNALTKATCYLVYVTTREMAVYFKNPKNGCADMFALKPGATLSLEAAWFVNRPATFMSSVGLAFEAELTGAYTRDLSDDYCVRIVGVRAV
jgi:hypothetical protein